MNLDGTIIKLSKKLKKWRLPSLLSSGKRRQPVYRWNKRARRNTAAYIERCFDASTGDR
jgi:hypothetical protein